MCFGEDCVSRLRSNHSIPSSLISPAPVCASLQTQSSSKHLLLSLLSLLTPSRTRQNPVYAEGCLDTDHTDELIQSVSSLADCYSVGEPLSDDDYSD